MDAGRKLRRLSITPCPGLDGEFAAQVVAAARAAEAVDGAPPLNDEQLAALEHPESLRNNATITHFPVQEAVGTIEHPGDAGPFLNELVGYGVLIEYGAADPVGALFIHPDHRRQGIGRALIARMHEFSADNVHVWAPGDTAAAQRLARAAHMVPVRELLVMSRPLDSHDPAAALPEVATPAGVKLRHFIISRDQEPFLEVNRRAFAHHPEQGSLEAKELQAKLKEPWFDRTGFFVAIDQTGAPAPDDGRGVQATQVMAKDGRLLGFHWTKRHEDGTGEVYVIGVDPDAEGRGLAKALLVRGLRHLLDQGCKEVILYVEGDHEKAVGLYERFGFVVRNRDVLYAQHLDVETTGDH